ncbi:MAG TPA: N-acetyl-1-D-myo-inositol-2-amino-2-deoxy-alpha-D-glucopyranoside deacetylase [Mycobacteriales bacterium]|jgi:N-acetyl-1-D-myo-inositol-2-amino-2-deoxy-alpha-D-glucopyranoside deacetylase|nr:N-acetyl-1-D-myo-inositol-2-amino-2-deoxy-alpha-D-glucopyranoside deacetylase [Mycobacteriales bacterium]
MSSDAGRRLLLVHAHPDDETTSTGAAMARYAAEGAEVTLVTCTLGEEGEVLVPALSHLAAAEGDQLGGYRYHELSRAMAELGVTDYRLLGGPGRWRDSGMMGLDTNAAPRAFWQADMTEATTALAEILREVRPQVVVTYDENGGYGHPDHIQAHRVAMAGVEAAADPGFAAAGPAWSVPKVYWTAMPRSAIQRGIDIMMEQGESGFFGASSVDDLPFVVPDELVTASLDARKYLPQKVAAMRAHASQIAADGPFFEMMDKLGEEAFGLEHYRLVRGEPGPMDGPEGRETDLFAGLD